MPSGSIFFLATRSQIHLQRLTERSILPFAQKLIVVLGKPQTAKFLHNRQVRPIVFDPEQEVITQWIK